MIEQLALVAAYAVRLWVVVPASDRSKVAVGPCSYEVAYDHVERWSAQQVGRGWYGPRADRPTATTYHLRPATAAEVAETRDWETKLRYERDQAMAA